MAGDFQVNRSGVMEMRITKLRTMIRALLVVACFAVPGAAASGADRSWSRIAGMPTARSELAAAELDGRIYVAGGIGQWGTSSAFEVYDPARHSWRRLAPLPTATHHPAMAAANDRIYLSGGYGDIFFSHILTGVWAYDPGTDRWNRVTSMPSPRAAHKLVTLGGKLYVVGGRGPDSSALWVYNPANGQWDMSRAALPTAREHLATAVVGGKLYVIGGRDKDHVNMAVVEVYDPKTDIWARRAGLPEPRGGHTAASVKGRIHVTGGEDMETGTVFADHWVYDPDVDRWQSAPTMPTPRHGIDSVVSGVTWYVIGGGKAAGYRTIFALTNRVEVYSTSQTTP